jgi:hypothetical protein
VSEKWKVIKNHPTYEISNFGRIRHKKKKRLRKTRIDNHGYERLCLSVQKNFKRKYYNLAIHKEVMRAFVGEAPDGMQVDHININPLDNKLSNLRYCTPRQNRQNIKNKSKYGFGVVKIGNKFYSKICHNGKPIKLGSFNNSFDAQRAYREKQIEIDKTNTESDK